MTDESFARLYAKKILTFDQFKNELLDYLTTEIANVFSFDFPLSGLGTKGAQMPMVRASSSVINIGATGGPFLATDGAGHVFSLANADARLQGVHLPTGLADATVLSIGLERALFDQSLEVNPRTQKAAYRKTTEGIGRRGTPNAVTDNGNGTLTLTVDAVTEAGVNHAGRTVTVWLKPLEDGGAVGPQSAVDATAIETHTVAFVAGSNQITTTAQFGQTVASVLASDYVIVLNGPTVRKKVTEDLSTTVGCLFLGTATALAGDAANAIDTSGQVLLIGAGELLKVLKRGPHLGLKVQVAADTLDAVVNQIAIVGTDGATKTYSADEQGKIDTRPLIISDKAARIFRDAAGNQRWTIDPNALPSARDINLWREDWKGLFSTATNATQTPDARWVSVIAGAASLLTVPPSAVYGGNRLQCTYGAASAGNHAGIATTQKIVRGDGPNLVWVLEVDIAPAAVDAQDELFVGFCGFQDPTAAVAPHDPFLWFHKGIGVTTIQPQMSGAGGLFSSTIGPALVASSTRLMRLKIELHGSATPHAVAGGGNARFFADDVLLTEMNITTQGYCVTEQMYGVIMGRGGGTSTNTVFEAGTYALSNYRR